MIEPLDDVCFRTLFEMANDAIIVVDVEKGCIVDANIRASEFVGRSLEDLRGMHYLDLVPEYARTLVASRFKRHENEAEESIFAKCPLQHTNGSILICELSGRRFIAKNRNLALGIFRDISERVKRNEQLRLRTLAIQKIESGVTIADASKPDFPLIYANEGFSKMTGYSPEEILGKNCRFLQIDETSQPAAKKIREALQAGESHTTRLRNYRKDGSFFWNELHLSPVFNEAKELTHYVGIQIDVSERVRSRQLIEESERRYRTLTNSVHDFIMRRHRNGTITYASPSVKQQLGWSHEELCHKNYFELIHPKDLEDINKQLAKIEGCSDASVTLNYRVLQPDNQYRWVESTENPLRAPCGTTEEIVSVGRDITARRDAECQVRKRLREEQELNEIKSRFIRMVSHEFRTPLTGIRASASFLQEYGKNISEDKRKRHFKNIESALTRMDNILHNVLIASQGENVQIPIALEATQPLFFAEDLCESLLNIYTTRKIKINCKTPPLKEYPLDPYLLNHIFQNLLTNALKYSHEESIVTWEIIENKEKQTLDWIVTDQGIGIPENEHQYLYNPFARAKNVGHISGTGLGLHIAKRATSVLGGSIDLNHNYKDGAQFIVSLPIDPPNTIEGNVCQNQRHA